MPWTESRRYPAHCPAMLSRALHRSFQSPSHTGNSFQTAGRQAVHPDPPSALFTHHTAATHLP